MKKISFLLLLIFPISVFALEKDTFYVEEYDFSLKILDRDMYKVEEKFKTKLEYSYFPDTYFFKRKIGDTYTYTFNNKNYEYKNNIKLNDFTDKYFAFDEDVGLSTSFGHEGILLSREENFLLNYDVIFNDKTDEIFSYYIGDIDIDIKKTNFEIILPYLIDENKNILFSLDGKEFNKELDNLNYTVEHNQVIKGEYSKTLPTNSSIYFLIYDKADLVKIPSSNNLFIYIIPSIILAIIILYIYFLYRRKKSK